MSTATYQVTGMSCGHCEQAIRQEVTALDGLEVVSVDSGSGVLVVSAAAGDVDDAAVLAAVDEAGYQAVRV
ncbi:heavy metal transporter [Auraticoccus sp. F435]|uniref:Heavy metal transporter n=1 Tax=Auraticoccus cholistanensis TaxID=2656650 RepID=A0A6A9V252_9ACTN|nr:heavy-metal-associated domain-containing protein [Auraticoccus cholistanensis]MVA77639.1 heavy metal transporter [Auraticoccus cholistanensis]